MQINVLASSSNGNCYLISDGNSHLLIECGINIGKIKNKVQDLTSLSGCLITHEHADHSKSFKEMLHYTNVYASKKTLEYLVEKQNISRKFSHKYKELIASKTYNIGTFLVVPFNVEHDALEPLGFLIYSTKTKEKLLFATDTYYIKPRFKNLNYIMVECNFSKDLLDENIDKTVRDRLYQSHFELENVKGFLKANNLSKVRNIYLMHISSTNGDPIRFKKEIEELTGIPTIICERE